MKTEVSRAPDGGYGWVVVFGAFVIQGICIGSQRTSSILYTQLLINFNQSAAATSSVFAIFGLTKTFISPISSMLCNTYSHRAVAMVGGVLMTTGLVITAYAPSLLLVNLSHSIITGMGFGLTFTATLCITPLYFKRRRGRAAAIGFLGGDLGAVALVALLQFFFSEFNYTGGFVLFGGVCLHICVAAALFRPLKPLQGVASENKDEEPNKHIEHVPITVAEAQASPSDTATDKSDVKLQNITCHKIKGKNREFEEVITKVSTQLGLSFEDGTKKESIETDDNSCNIEHEKPTCTSLRAIGSWFYSKFDLGLLKNTQVVWFCVHIMTLFAAGLAALSVISELCLELGFTKEQVAFILMISNAAIIPLKLLTTSGFDIPVIRYYDQLVMAIMGVCMGVSMLVMPLATSFPAMTVVYGIHLYVFMAMLGNYVNAMAAMVGPSRITSAVGLLRSLCGLAELISVALAGVVKDTMGSFCWSLWVIGGIYLFVVTLYLIRVIYWTFLVRPHYKADGENYI